jgi:hypothetical protein
LSRELIRELETILTEMENRREYGTIEIQVSDGVPALLRKSTTKKLCTGEKNRAHSNSRY